MTDTDSRRKLQARLAEAHDLARAALVDLSKRGVHLPRDHPLNKLIHILGHSPNPAQANMVEAAEMRLDGKSWLEVENAMQMDTSNYRKRDRMKPEFDEILDTLRFFRDPERVAEIYRQRNQAYLAEIHKRRK